MNHDRTHDRLGTLFINLAGELQENTFYDQLPKTIIGVRCCLNALFFSHFSPSSQ